MTMSSGTVKEGALLLYVDILCVHDYHVDLVQRVLSAVHI